ncbi:hypothetical protein [Nocardia salmonicida]|uniref:hypothetical protein n=1 Tax=Nocardia salmonicida TaxID=53431 RepID=UPI002E2A517B|nr:hypothetical protein [Nocardia salmonicida]
MARPLSTSQISTALGSLLLLSAVTHVSQLIVYGGESHVIGSAGFGVLYGLLGIGVLRGSRWAYLGAAIFPTIGGLLGIYRFFFLHPNPFSIFHPCLDLIIVPLAVIGWRRTLADRIPSSI